MLQIVNGICIASDETTDRSQALRESTHDKVYLVGKSEMIANTTSLTTEYTDAMSLVDHDRAIVFMLKLYDFRKLSQVALH